MVPAGIVKNNDHLTALPPAANKLFEEREKCICAEIVSSGNGQSSIGWTNSTEDPYALSCRFLQYKRIGFLWWNPHHAPGTMLLEVTFILEP